MCIIQLKLTINTEKPLFATNYAIGVKPKLKIMNTKDSYNLNRLNVKEMLKFKYSFVGI